MANMKKVKKALIGTAIAGTLAVGAGFGTYSWFTSHASVTGEVQNSQLEIVGSGFSAFQFERNAFTRLAPSRTVSTSLTISNDHGGDATYEDVLLRGKLAFAVNNAGDLLTSDNMATTFPRNGSYEGLAGYTLQEALEQYQFTFSWGSVEKTMSGWEWYNNGEDFLEEMRLNNGEKLKINVVIHLDKDANNNLQGATLRPVVLVDAKQIDFGALYQDEIDAFYDID
ncbi:hypothetical protein [Bacillus sp. FJAT-45066]|uniref:hypothetical protein n=1 Tax=Bacillus sp. FJAT-45066 TaxID=2011010 RepID=UPI000BB929CD|nr:hypothetical protein [Bacillus sp. FJAT-45066]